MSRSTTVGEKRGRDSEVSQNALKFIPGLTLSQHPSGQRKQLFMKKLDDVIRAKSLHPTEFEGYTIRERFQKMGWEQLLNLSCDKIYRRVVIQWVSSLSRNGDELTGIVDGKSYTITPVIVRDLLGIDTRTDLPYVQFNVADIQADKSRLCEAFKTVFGLVENAKKRDQGYEKSKMTPLMQVLWQIGLWTFHPCPFAATYQNIISLHEICLLHALFTGDCLYSFAHLMIDDIWDMYEHQHRRNIPHGYCISEILNRLGAVSEDEFVEIISPKHRVITRSSLYFLEFSESSTEYIIDDRVNLQRVTFPKKVIEREASPQTHVPNQDLNKSRLFINLQNPTNKQPSESQTQHSEIITMVKNIQKQIERLEKERERIEQARERREQERERREQERERQADIRAHAIIWDIERQRYFYEQEQEQLHRAWKKAYGSEEFQFPQISHTSFHPPQAGSRYYDPAQGNEIPKAFQNFFNDIYGTRR